MQNVNIHCFQFYFNYVHIQYIFMEPPKRFITHQI